MRHGRYVPHREIINKKTERVFRFNTFVPVYAMGSAVKVFLEQGGGNVINVASAGAMHTCAGATYCGSKAAIAPVSKKTAFMYMSRGVR
ncbi:MAG: SDR family NAD(P)-dependent oxidoreductase [Christensenellales bacterium]